MLVRRLQGRAAAAAAAAAAGTETAAAEAAAAAAAAAPAGVKEIFTPTDSAGVTGVQGHRQKRISSLSESPLGRDQHRQINGVIMMCLSNPFTHLPGPFDRGYYCGD
ncbi:hypothetical protein Cadr_000012576 [Camelus dromedarius]|uniref:Uncharacterized protein n=1 Tax=Camelus dromedarius TaxID=9838 RepID=A0A5N4D908_CAMDR|nr:hypothetical protein Cadr_000012576 [Camelus dromedarius]